MSAQPVMDKLVLQLLDKSKTVVWPTGEPEVKESWVKAANSPGCIEKRVANYQDTVLEYFYRLGDAGDECCRGKYDEGQTALQRTADEIARASEIQDEIRKKYYSLLCLANIIQELKLPVRQLKEAVYADLIYNEVRHDLGNLLSHYSLVIGKPLDDAEREKMYVIGRHVHSIGWNGANMLVHGKVEEFRVSDFTERLCAFFRYINRDTVQIAVDCGNVKINGDEAGLYRVGFNLVNNAIQRGKATKLLITARYDGDGSIVEFADNGRGLPNESDLFALGVSHSQSTGIGLFLAQCILEAHKGTITATAHGTCGEYTGALFSARLPNTSKAESQVIYTRDF